MKVKKIKELYGRKTAQFERGFFLNRVNKVMAFEIEGVGAMYEN